MSGDNVTSLRVLENDQPKVLPGTENTQQK